MIYVDGFGETGRPVSDGVQAAIPPNVTLQIDLELVSWKTMVEVTDDKKVIKKILKEGEGYERPNEGAVVKCKCKEFTKAKLIFCHLTTQSCDLLQ